MIAVVSQPHNRRRKLNHVSQFEGLEVSGKISNTRGQKKTFFIQQIVAISYTSFLELFSYTKQFDQPHVFIATQFLKPSQNKLHNLTLENSKSIPINNNNGPPIAATESHGNCLLRVVSFLSY